VHRVEEVFALGVDVHAEPVALAAEALLQRGDRLARARDVGDDDHRELALHDRLVDVDDAATRLGQNLRDGRDDARVVYAEDRYDEPVGPPLGRARAARLAARADDRLDGAVDVHHQRLDRPLVGLRPEAAVDRARDSVDEFLVCHFKSRQHSAFSTQPNPAAGVATDLKPAVFAWLKAES
jgi:hypothetical protein